MVSKIQNAPLSFKLVLLNLISLIFIFSLIHFYVFPAVEEMFIESYKEKVRNTVEIVHGILSDTHARIGKGEISESEAKRLAINAIKSVRYNEKEYFWIHNLDLRMVAHPTLPELENTDLTNKADPDGILLYVEINKLINANGDGFLRYRWPKPGSKEIVEKYSYSKLFKPWGWIPGSGIYFDQIHGTVSALRYAVYGGVGFAALLSIIFTVLFSRKLSQNFKEALQALSVAGSEMSELSSSLAQTGQSVSQGVSESSASITQTSASMEEIFLMSQKNSDNSIQTHSYASQCLSATRQGMAIVGDVKKCMSEITKSNENVLVQNKQSAKRISEIIHVIQGIADKTKVINDIVFQTKLLSFNASVEAARAGEAGKGFAVVAEEVGSLAAMSGSAAHDIEKSLAESIANVESIIKEDVTLSQSMIEDAAKKVNEGEAVVEKCETIFHQILSQVTQVNELSDQISSSCKEQNIGFDEIKKAVMQLEETSQINARASEEVATSVERMVDQVQKVQTQSDVISKLIDGNKTAA